MRRLKSVELIATLSIHHSGASIQQQVIERRVVLSDNAYWLALVILSWLAGIGWRLAQGVARVWDWLFVGWGDDLRLMREAVILLIIGVRNGKVNYF